MTGQGQGQVIATNPTTVIAHSHQLHPTLLHIHADGFRAGIQRVFQQLFQYRGGALHHLTGGDLVGKAGIKQLDLCHGRLC